MAAIQYFFSTKQTRDSLFTDLGTLLCYKKGKILWILFPIGNEVIKTI